MNTTAIENYGDPSGVTDWRSRTAVPNFVIAGAPKSGTTALYEYLHSHPAVFLTTPKEPHFFAEDLFAHRSVFHLDDYERLFSTVEPRHTAVGEASVWSLHSEVAIEKLVAYRPDVKLVIMLRRPTEMLVSLHSDLCWVCFEDQPDFEKAWALQEVRRTGSKVPKLCQVPWFLDYQRVGSLGMHVDRLLHIVAREQIKFILFDDFRTEPQRIYEEVLQFLNLRSDGRTSFPQVNASKRNRSVLLAQCRASLIQAMPRRLIDFGKRLGLDRLSHAWMRANTRARSSARLRPEMHELLIQAFSDDIDRLSVCLQRDLSSWKELPTPRVTT